MYLTWVGHTEKLKSGKSLEIYIKNCVETLSDIINSCGKLLSPHSAWWYWRTWRFPVLILGHYFLCGPRYYVGTYVLSHVVAQITPTPPPDQPPNMTFTWPLNWGGKSAWGGLTSNGCVGVVRAWLIASEVYAERPGAELRYESRDADEVE